MDLRGFILNQSIESIMKTKHVLLLALLAFFTLHSALPTASAQGTAFTYQGQLSVGGSPANSNYDLTFALFNNSTTNTGQQIGTTQTNLDVGVTNGLFIVRLNFGDVFSGTNYWLAIGVRTNGGSTFTALNPLQEVTPAPYAIYSPNAGTAASAGSVAASNISGTISNSSLPSSPDFSGTVAAASFSGNGSNLNSLNASNLLTGTVADARLSTNVPLLNKNQLFTGNDGFSDGVAITTTGNPFALDVYGGVIGGFTYPLVLFQNISTADNVSPALRLVNNGNSPNGVLSVSSEGTGLLAQFGNASAFVAQLDTNGNWTANSFSGSGIGLTSVNASTLGGTEVSSATGLDGVGFGSNSYLMAHPLYLRGDEGVDHNHGLAYSGYGVTNFPNTNVQPDGPVLWGFTGGVLGVLDGGAQAALSWNNSSVSVANALNVGGSATVAGNLSANNTPGVNWTQTTNFGEGTLVPDDAVVTLDSTSNNKPAAGYFVIMAWVFVQPGTSLVSLNLYDTTTSPSVLLTSGYAVTDNELPIMININWVVPITSPGDHEAFTTTIQVDSSGTYYFSHNLTVMYFPRLNN
jgi:hypothetical protein